MSDKRGAELTKGDELLWRQVYPSWLEDEGRPSSRAFYPWRELDEGCLSVDREFLTTPESAYRLFTTERPLGFGMDSAGVWGLSVGEVGMEGITAWEEPVESTASTPPNPAHALLEFNGLESRTWKKAGRILKVKACDRGRLFPL